jgi:hypothetical protein
MPHVVVTRDELEQLKQQILHGQFTGGVPKVTDSIQVPAGPVNTPPAPPGPSVLESTPDKIARETKAVLNSVGGYFSDATKQAWSGAEDLMRTATGMQPLSDAEQGSVPARLASGAHKLVVGNAKAGLPLFAPEMLAAPGATALALGAGVAGQAAGSSVGSMFDAPGSTAYADLGGDIAGFGLAGKTASALARAQVPSTKLVPSEDGIYRPQSTVQNLMDDLLRRDPYPQMTSTAHDIPTGNGPGVDETLALSRQALGMTRNSRSTPPLPYSRAALNAAIMGAPKQLPALGQSSVAERGLAAVNDPSVGGFSFTRAGMTPAGGYTTSIGNASDVPPTSLQLDPSQYTIPKVLDFMETQDHRMLAPNRVLGGWAEPSGNWLEVSQNSPTALQAWNTGLNTDPAQKAIWDANNFQTLFGPSRQLPAAGGTGVGKFGAPSPKLLKLQYQSNEGMPLTPVGKQGELSVEGAKDIAKAYDALPKDSNSPEAKAAYGTMATEIQKQWDHAVQAGYQLEPWTKEGQPYANSKEMAADVNDNKHLYFFTGGEEHPALGQKDAQGLSFNDKFRAVHDLFGHATGGFSFGPKGEEAAWRTHSGMFSPDARRAMTTETRGQNSWVNFGPNSGLPVTERPYAEQKFALLPDQYVFPQQGPFNLPARSESSQQQWTPDRGALGMLQEPFGKLDTGAGRPWFASPESLPVTQSKEGFSVINPRTKRPNEIALSAPTPDPNTGVPAQRPVASRIAPGWEKKLSNVGIKLGEQPPALDVPDLFHIGKHGELDPNPETAKRLITLMDYGHSIVGSNWTDSPRLSRLFEGLTEHDPAQVGFRAFGALSPRQQVPVNTSEMVMFAARLKALGKKPADLDTRDWDKLMEGIGNRPSKEPNLNDAIMGRSISSYRGDKFSQTGKVEHLAEGMHRGKEGRGFPFDMHANRGIGFWTDNQPTNSVGYESLYRPVAKVITDQGMTPFSGMANLWSAQRDIFGIPSEFTPEDYLAYAGVDKLPNSKRELSNLVRDLRFGKLISGAKDRMVIERGMPLSGLFGVK